MNIKSNPSTESAAVRTRAGLSEVGNRRRPNNPSDAMGPTETSAKPKMTQSNCLMNQFKAPFLARLRRFSAHHTCGLRRTSFLILACALLALSPRGRAADITDGLMAHWPFDSGSLQDASGNGNVGLNNGAVPVPDIWGVANGAYQFDGVDDSIDIGTGVKPGFPLTVSTRFKGVGKLFSNDSVNSNGNRHGIQVAIDPNAAWISFFSGFATSGTRYSRTGTISGQFDDGAWHTVVFVCRSRSDVDLYIDGQLVEDSPGSGTGGNHTYTETGRGYIGDALPDSSAPFLGVIDDVRVYERALSLSEVGISTTGLSITQQPIDTEVLLGDQAEFSVEIAEVTPAPTYQWYFNGAPVDGATGATLNIDNAQLADAGTYHVEVGYPHAKLNSNSAVLSVQCVNNIGGDVFGQVWTKAQSPYCITNDVNVLGLQIEAGVEVVFHADAEFKVGGGLRVNGTADEPVHFFPAHSAVKWQGLVFADSIGGDHLTHAIIEGSKNSGIRITDTAPVLTNCWIINNSTPGKGAGISASMNAGKDFIISGCTFLNNSASLGGGGIWVDIGNGKLELQNCKVEGNSAVGVGGGMAAYPSGEAQLVVNESVFKANSVTHSQSNSRGGGLYIQADADSAPEIRILKTAIDGNQSVYTGSTGFAQAAGLELRGSRFMKSLVRNCRIVNNKSVSSKYSDSAGLWHMDSLYSVVANTIIANNTITVPSGAGGKPGVMNWSGNLLLRNCVVVENFPGYGVFEWTGSVEVINSIIWGNNNSADQFLGDIAAMYSCVQNGWPGEGNISVNPGFCENRSLTIIPGVVQSPCIDAGHPGFQYRDLSINDQACTPFARGTARNDMGAYGGPWGIGWSEPPVEPVIVVQPGIDRVIRARAMWDQDHYENSPVGYIALKGKEWTAGVEAYGQDDLEYQWFRDGQPLLNETGPKLTLPSTQLSHTGIYTVVVSNTNGQIASREVGVRVAELGVEHVGLDAGKPQLRIWNGAAGQQAIVYRRNDLGSSSETAVTTDWPLVETIDLSDSEVLWTDPTPLAPGEVRFYGVVPTE